MFSQTVASRRGLALAGTFVYVFLAFSAILGCRSGASNLDHVSKANPLPSSEQTGVVELSTFFQFSGLSYGDSRSKVRELFGLPSETSYTERLAHERFNNGSVRISYDHSGKVVSMAVNGQSGVNFLHKKAIYDANLRFIGATRYEVFRVFGAPVDDHADNYEYRYRTSDGRSVWVTFICYNHDKYVCSELSVFW